MATVASVYFIEIKGNPAAALCWVDRMLVFSLFLVLTVAIIYQDAAVKRYATPFLLVGLPLASFQQLVFWDVIKLPVRPCGTGLVCTQEYFNLLGFISQATLCLAAFMIIGFCVWQRKKR